MLIETHVETRIEDKTLPQQNIRRLANGSIDYSFYDQCARANRGVAFRAAIGSLKAHVRRLIDLMAGSRPARQPQINQVQARLQPRCTDQRVETVITSRKSYSKAA